MIDVNTKNIFFIFFTFIIKNNYSIKYYKKIFELFNFYFIQTWIYITHSVLVKRNISKMLHKYLI